MFKFYLFFKKFDFWTSSGFLWIDLICINSLASFYIYIFCLIDCLVSGRGIDALLISFYLFNTRMKSFTFSFFFFWSFWWLKRTGGLYSLSSYCYPNLIVPWSPVFLISKNNLESTLFLVLDIGDKALELMFVLLALFYVYSVLSWHSNTSNSCDTLFSSISKNSFVSFYFIFSSFSFNYLYFEIFLRLYFYYNNDWFL
jgi:hypothetical protein